MLRVKLLKPTKYGSVGSVVVIDRNEAFGLIDSGKAILSKDMTSDDIKTKTVKQAEDKNGKPIIIRPHLTK